MNNLEADWVRIIKNIDPILEKNVNEFSQYLTEQGSEIPQKYKELILMACSAAIRHAPGVQKRGYEAMHHGATDKEIIEVLALASLATGIGTLSDGIISMREQFTKPSSDD
jgi:alkylhydroperoxidase/carboxymuconolactone decarboxylase family protein YurZ|tara:strand:- start:527 stop:859 length:333 start_codon:yes stop_codon:yes gene_type:complete